MDGTTATLHALEAEVPDPGSDVDEELAEDLRDDSVFCLAAHSGAASLTY